MVDRRAERPTGRQHQRTRSVAPALGDPEAGLQGEGDKNLNARRLFNALKSYHRRVNPASRGRPAACCPCAQKLAKLPKAALVGVIQTVLLSLPRPGAPGCGRQAAGARTTKPLAAPLRRRHPLRPRAPQAAMSPTGHPAATTTGPSSTTRQGTSTRRSPTRTGRRPGSNLPRGQPRWTRI